MRRWRFHRTRKCSTIAPAGQPLEKRPVIGHALIVKLIVAAAAALLVYQVVSGA